MESYGLNTIVIGIITIVIAIIALCLELRKRYEEKVENQILLLDGLLSELETISADYSEVYGGKPTHGNLQWYEEQISLKNEQSLDHDINPLSYSVYTTKFNSSILNIDTKKLVRTLSYINDKIQEINSHTKKLQEIKTSDLKEELENIKTPEKFKEFLKKTLETDYFDELKEPVKTFLEKNKNYNTLIKDTNGLSFFNIKISLIDNNVSIEKTTDFKSIRSWLLGVIKETKIKVGSLKKLLETQKKILNKK